MRTKHIESRLWLPVSVLAALVCAGVRRWQFASAFEGELGLPIPMAPASVVLVMVLIISAAVLLLMAMKQPVDPVLKEQPELSLYCGKSTVFLFAMVCAAVLSLAAAPMFLLNGRRSYLEYQAMREINDLVLSSNNGVLMMVAAATSMLAFFGLIAATKAAVCGGSRNRMGVLLPVLNGCLWMMELYRDHAAEPVRWNYAPLLLAAAAGILFYLGCAGLYAANSRPRCTLWLAGVTVVLSAVALAGGWDICSAPLLASQILSAAAVLWCMPVNLKYPPAPPAEEAADEEEKLEEENP